MFRPFHWLRQFFEAPLHVLLFCTFFLFLVLVSDGTLLRLWSLHSASQKMSGEEQTLQMEMTELSSQIELANQPDFVEKKARDHFDLVEKGEILFLFSEENDL